LYHKKDKNCVLIPLMGFDSCVKLFNVGNLEFYLVLTPLDLGK